MDSANFQNGFFEEAAEHISAIAQLALTVDIARPDADDLAAMFRAAHSLKGGAYTFGFRALADATHALESLLDALRQRTLECSAEVVQVTLEITDMLSAILDSYRLAQPIDPSVVDAVGAHVKSVFALSEDRHETPEVSFELFEPLIADEPVPAEQHSADKAVSIRVDLRKIDQLINVVGELVIAHAMLAEQTAGFDEIRDAGVIGAIERVGRHTRELRESVMSIRMVPIGTVFARFPRMVHDVSSQLGKRAALVARGSETELDKSLTERLVDPLTHLIRNALDHGLETPEEREAAGKAPEGRIELVASHESGNIVIRVRDDGRGLDRARILERARERGIDVAEQATEADISSIIFESGFSTAQAVSELSGRGVGMDVVRKNVMALQGSVEVESTPGKGTTVTIRMPLTLAILDGLAVRSGSETYIIALNSIVESVPVENVEHIDIGNGNMLMSFRGEWLPVIDLGALFAIPDRSVSQIAVIFESGGTRAALLVESLEAQHQVVIKSVEANFRRVLGIAGATVLGTGRVAFILDLSGLLRLHEINSRNAPSNAPVEEAMSL
jgi:two-component system chemotaxis sensor kinase CheA